MKHTVKSAKITALLLVHGRLLLVDACEEDGRLEFFNPRDDSGLVTLELATTIPIL